MRFSIIIFYNFDTIFQVNLLINLRLFNICFARLGHNFIDYLMKINIFIYIMQKYQRILKSKKQRK